MFIESKLKSFRCMEKSGSILLGLLLFGSSSLSYAVIEHCDQSVNFDNTQTYSDISGVINCYESENKNTKTRQVELKNGKKHGKTTYFSAYNDSKATSNKVVRVENYQNGEATGEFVTYESDSGKVIKKQILDKGHLLSEERFDLRTGVIHMSFYKPNLNATGEQELGRLSLNKLGQLINFKCSTSKTDIKQLDTICGFNGTVKHNQLYDDDGLLTSEQFVKQGETIQQTLFYPSGEIRAESSENEQRFFYEDGVLEEQLISGANKQETLKKYFENGKLKELLRSQKGTPLEHRLWYMSEKPKFIGLYDIGSRTATVKYYYPNGQLKQDYSYVTDHDIRSFTGDNNRYVGEHHFYLEDGTLFKQKKFSDNGQLLQADYFYKSGNLKKTTIEHDDKSKTVKTYDEQGSLTKMIELYPDGSTK